MTPSFSLAGTWLYRPVADDDATYDMIIASHPDEWQKMTLPANWHVAGLPSQDGTVWFRRSFDSVPHDGLIPLLTFAGVDYIADVWLNGTFLGHHEGYFAPFTFAAESLQEGPNDLVVRVFSPREEAGPVWPHRKRAIKGIFGHHDCRPGAWHPTFGQDGNTGGIWNDVTLSWRPAVRIQDVQTLVSLEGDAATVVVRIGLAGLTAAQNLPVYVTCRDAAGRIVDERKTTIVVSPEDPIASLGLRIAAPELWWSWDHGDQPLYDLDVAVGDDAVSQRFSIRTIHQEGDAWFLNGQRTFLRGTNIIPALWLSTYTAEQIATDVRLMKEAGLNIVRVHAHVTRPEFYDACDAAGLMVWQDFSLQWSYDLSPDFAAEAVSQIRAMVRLLRHHPSIVIWCCHNEPAGQEFTLDPLLVQAVRAEDGERIVRSHSDFSEHPYPGWYYGHTQEFAALPGAPLISEFGAQALPSVETLQTFLPPDKLWPADWEAWSYHDFQYEQTFWVAGVEPGESLESFVEASQRYQGELLRYAIDTYRRARYSPITGVFQFMFVDGWPSITWSVLDYLRQPKLGYQVLKEVCSPVYLSVRLATPVSRAGLPLPVSVILINDLHETIIGVTISFRLLTLAESCVAEWPAQRANMAADDKIDLSKAWEKALTLPTGQAGSYVLEGRCTFGAKTLSLVRIPVIVKCLPEALVPFKTVDMG
ncbi:MAG: beta-galactosidase [Candidatus Sericytochromatia bacterium]|nr:beta-galactosidase [Candidatus Sericytochromatia bacterium]